jgi:hypothetical protein
MTTTTATSTHALRAPGLAQGLGARLGLRRGAAWGATCLGLDAAMLASAVVAARLGAGVVGVDSFASGWTVVFAALALALFGVKGLYTARLRLDIVEDARALLVRLSLAAMTVLALQVLFGGG